MPRTPHRLVLTALLSAFAVMPASAMAAPELYLDDTIVSGSGLADGILAAGDTVNVVPSFTVGAVPFEGGNTTFSAPSGSNVSATGYVQPLPAGSIGEGTYPANPFVVTLGANYVCGTNVPAKAMVDGPQGHGEYKLNIPTGVAGPHTRYVSEDVGDAIADADSIDSQIQVTATGKVKSIKVHLDDISHTYSLRWYDITLVSPSGTRVKVWSRGGDDTQKYLHNVTFTDSAALTSNSASIQQFSDIEVRSDEKLSQFYGEDATGPNPWTLEVKDVHDVNTARSNRVTRSGLGRSGGGGEIVGQVDAWSMDLATAECGRKPVPAVAPEPLVLNPAPTPTLPATVVDGSESVDPGKNNAGTADGAIVKYEWDLDGQAGYETDTNGTPNVTFPGGPQGKRKISLQVTDSDGQKVSKEYEALITRPPAISAAVATPSAPEAGQLTTLEANAADPDGTIAQYQWDFDGDGIFEVTRPDNNSTTYSWPTSGPHVVRVKVTDNVGATAIKPFIVTVANKPPVAKLKASASPVVLGVPVTFDASESADPDGTIVKYEWDADGFVGYETSGEAPTYTTVMNQSGARTVNVRVTDNSGQTAVATMNIVVAAPPKAVANASATNVKPGVVVTFDGRSSTDSEVGGSISKYEWDLDGNNSYESTGALVTKSYPNVGNVQVKLRVTGSTGAKGDTFVMVSVANPVVVPTPIPGGNPTPTPTLTPTLTPKPNAGVGEVPVLQPGIKANVPGLDPSAPVTENRVESAKDAFISSDTPIAGGVLPSGFQAKITVASKQKVKKALKGGIVVKVTANAPGVIVVKGMVAAKLAKKMGLKPKKNAALAVASGKLVIKKAGTYKFVVKVPKKYQRYVKKSKKTAMTLRSAVTETSTKNVLALGKTITIVK